MDYAEIRQLAKRLEQNQYKPEDISFKSDWNGWKLAYDDALLSGHESEAEVVENTAKAVEDKNYKLVFRGSGNVFCTYILAFVHDDPKDLPFFMLNRSEIYDHYEDFSERINLDEEECKIIFRADDKAYEFEQDGDFIKRYGSDASDIFLDEDLWELTYFGHFDPKPLTLQTDGWGRRMLAPDETVPKV